MSAPPQHTSGTSEVLPGIVLILCAAAAIAIANSPLAPWQTLLLKAQVAVSVNDATLAMSVSAWIKNALMAVFFLFVGLELKRELREGALADPRRAALPAFAALGGMVVPGLIYLAVAGGSETRHGWAIPAATDIAFALGVLSLLGNRVPPALKAFLLAIAVVDDLGAILIVAVAYSQGVDPGWLAWAGVWLLGLLVLNLFRVGQTILYLPFGLALWLALQNSGVNPTITGVLVAACIPMRDGARRPTLYALEERLRMPVQFFVMPVFAFANAGVSFADGFMHILLHPAALGAALGLGLGKPIGIVGATLLAASRLKAPLPGRLPHIVGVGFIAGVGFTMSLFIGSLAFTDEALAAPVRVGVYAGSVSAALVGLVILAVTLGRGRRAGTTGGATPVAAGAGPAKPVSVPALAPP